MHVSVTVSEVWVLDIGGGFVSLFDSVFRVGGLSVVFVFVIVTMYRWCGLIVFSELVLEYDWGVLSKEEA